MQIIQSKYMEMKQYIATYKLIFITLNISYKKCLQVHKKDYMFDCPKYKLKRIKLHNGRKAKT